MSVWRVIAGAGIPASAGISAGAGIPAGAGILYAAGIRDVLVVSLLMTTLP
jgi:hypothetical protein